MERGPEEVVLRAVRLPEDMPGLFDRIEAFGPARLGCGDASCRIEVDARWCRVPASARRLALQAEVGGEAARLQVGFMPEQVALCMRRRRLTVRCEARVWQLDEMRLARLELVGHASARGLHQRLELGGPGGELLARLGPAAGADRGDPCGWRLALQQALN